MCGFGKVCTWGHGTWGCGTRGHGLQGFGDLGMQEYGDTGTWDMGTWGHDKQTSPDFCAKCVKYNFQSCPERQG